MTKIKKENLIDETGKTLEDLLNQNFKIIEGNTIDLTWTTGNNEEQYDISQVVPSTPSGYTLNGCLEAHFNGNMKKVNIFYNGGHWYVNAYNFNQYGGRRTLYTTWLFKKN